jgi:hypothetical protein
LTASPTWLRKGKTLYPMLPHGRQTHSKPSKDQVVFVVL